MNSSISSWLSRCAAPLDRGAGRRRVVDPRLDLGHVQVERARPRRRARSARASVDQGAQRLLEPARRAARRPSSDLLDLAVVEAMAGCGSRSRRNAVVVRPRRARPTRRTPTGRAGRGRAAASRGRPTAVRGSIGTDAARRDRQLVAAPPGLRIERRAGRHVVRDVGDVDPDLGRVPCRAAVSDRASSWSRASSGSIVNASWSRRSSRPRRSCGARGLVARGLAPRPRAGSGCAAGTARRPRGRPTRDGPRRPGPRPDAPDRRRGPRR